MFKMQIKPTEVYIFCSRYYEYNFCKVDEMKFYYKSQLFLKEI